MVSEYKLKGNELLIYAIVYGFSQDGNSGYEGGLQYLADWTNSTKQGVLKNIKSLLDKGLISKYEYYKNNTKLVKYHSTLFNGGIKQSLINNIIDNINKKENIIKEKICFDDVVDWETLFTYWENNKSGGKYKNKESRNRMLDRLKKLTGNNFEFAKECIVFCIDSGYQGFCNGNELYYKHTPVKDEKTVCIADGQFFCDNSMEEFKDMSDEQCSLAVKWLLRNFRYETIPYSKFVSMVRKFKS